jgi:uncharacterized cupredoxin-like copper-binding protein
MKTTPKTLTLLALACLPAFALAGGEHGGHGAKPAAATEAKGHDMAGMHKDMHESMAGMAGDPAKVSRTIPVELNDTMRFTPNKISVKAGETVRFFIVNKGKLPHEMVIGMPDEIEEHAAMMKKMPGMVHKEANQITLEPGKRGGIVWQFAKAGTVSFACLVPGHKEAGMVGTVEVN